MLCSGCGFLLENDLLLRAAFVQVALHDLSVFVLQVRALYISVEGSGPLNLVTHLVMNESQVLSRQPLKALLRHSHQVNISQAVLRTFEHQHCEHPEVGPLGECLFNDYRLVLPSLSRIL